MSAATATLEAQLKALTAQVERLAGEVARLASRELAAAAICQSGPDDDGEGSLHFARQAMARGIEIGRQMAGAETHPRSSRPAPHRKRHGLRLVAAGES